MTRSKVKFWVKMNMMEGTDSWVMQCKRIGEAHLFGYILSTMNREDMTWSTSPAKQNFIHERLGISESSMFNYLKFLCKRNLLIKISRGNYKIHENYIQYGTAKKSEASGHSTDQ